jgi:hypothetical protein
MNDMENKLLDFKIIPLGQEGGTMAFHPLEAGYYFTHSFSCLPLPNSMLLALSVNDSVTGVLSLLSKFSL